MARVMSVVPGPRIFWARWHEFHTTAGKDSGGDEALRIFMDNLPAGDLLRVLEFGCGQGEQAIGRARSGCRVSAFHRSPVAITAARRDAEKSGVRALLPDAPGAA